MFELEVRQRIPRAATFDSSLREIDSKDVRARQPLCQVPGDCSFTAADVEDGGNFFRIPQPANLVVVERAQRPAGWAVHFHVEPSRPVLVVDGAVIRDAHAVSNSCTYTAATRLQEKSRSAHVRPLRPISAARAGLFRSVCNDSRSVAGSSSENKNPVTPSCTTASLPATRLATIGFPQAIASSTTFGMPS